MLSDNAIKYLSVAGSISSIIALVIAVVAKLDIVSGLCIVVSIVGAIILGAVSLWLMNYGHERYVAQLESKALSWMYYFITGLLAIVLVCCFFLVLWGVLSLLLTGFITVVKEGLAF